MAAQDVDFTTNSPYETDWVKDGIWTGVGIGVSAYGLYLNLQKDDFTEQELNNLNKDDIAGIDRWVAGNSSESANSLSDIPFYASFAMPLVLLYDKNERSHAGQIAGLYVETMATTAVFYTMSSALIDRTRPLTYDTSLETDERADSKNKSSFLGGHVAATTAATMFAAKVYHDFNPNSKYRKWVWLTAGALPLAVGYLRMEAGKHFLTDNLAGYAVGIACGILVPELHRKKNADISLFPLIGNDYRAMALTYKF
ncbi:hypothetical protein GCM10009117_22920 [Gangjinia marincola]|uniref:Phosphatidic acid phosphatase type 2/haloperoxidase domain-containing protein n=2 Tax=Gangjinia marincola TaxID=578463 RepID=A0ABP3XV50_9FLAO